MYVFVFMFVSGMMNTDLKFSKSTQVLEGFRSKGFDWQMGVVLEGAFAYLHIYIGVNIRSTTH